MRLAPLASSLVVALVVTLACSDSDPSVDSDPSSAGQSSGSGGSAAEAGATSGDAGEPAQGGGAGGAPQGGASPQGGDAPSSGGDNEPGGAGPVAGAAGSDGLEPRTLPCEASMREDFPLNAGKVNQGVVTNQASGDGYVTVLDASSGGLLDAPTSSWVYAKFTRAGLQKVEVDDEQSLTSLAWDIAVKRYLIRLNGGDGGPSSVTSVALPDSDYEDITTIPSAATFESESFYDDECVLQQNASGVGEPRLSLDAYYNYIGCAQMTETPFVLELANGEHVKLEVESFYGTGQDTCDTTGQPGTMGANFTWRWQYL